MAAEPPEMPPQAPQSLDPRIQSLKQEAMESIAGSLVLEKELLFPASTQMAVSSRWISGLCSISTRCSQARRHGSDKHLYTEREAQALHRGGVQRLYIGNLRAGKHD